MSGGGGGSSSSMYNRNESQSSMSSSTSSYRRGNSGRRGGSNSRQPSNLNSLPFEQGIICTLKESFGFIHCAERPEEIFFHYSEVTNCHPDDLQIDTEVEFRVGTSGGGGGGSSNSNSNSISNSSSGDSSKKLAAFSVQTLERGTVVWETEENEGRFYRGVVEKTCSAPRGGNSNGSHSDGTIRLLITSEDEEETTSNSNSNDDDNNDSPPAVSSELPGVDSGGNINNNNNNDSGKAETKKKKKKQKKKKNGPVVRMTAGEYTGAKKENENEIIVNNSKRDLGSSNASNRLFKGDLISFRVFLDRRTKQKYARQITLLQSDRERKRIEKEKRLLENASEEEGVVISLNNGFGFIRSNRRRDDVYFHYSHLVIPEAMDNEDNVEFDLAKGQEVKFLVVTEEPERQNNNSNRSSNNNNNNVKISARQIHCLPKGSVLFHTVVAEGMMGVVTRAPHPPSPGSRGDDSRTGYVRLSSPLPDGNDDAIEREILLHYSDAPGGVFTYQNHRNVSASGVWIHEGDTLLFDLIKEVADGSYRAVPTLHKIGLGGSVIKPPNAANEENPDDKDMNTAVEKPAIRMVSLSLAGRAEGVVHTIKSDYGFIHFAERPVDVHFKTYDFMPEELQADIRRTMGFDESVSLEAEAAVQFDICAHGNITTTTQRGRRRGAQQARENIRGQRIVLLPKSTVALEKILATECKGVIKSINPQQLYTGAIDLEEEIIPMSMDERHPLVASMITSFLEESSLPNGRKSIVFRDTLGMNDDDVIAEMARLKGGTALECSHIPVPGIAPHPGRICIRRVENDDDDDDKADQGNAESEKDSAKPAASTKGKKKSKQQPSYRPVKSLRFEKGSLDEALKQDVPPSPGDVITCDIVQNRRNGKVVVKNLKIIERKFGEGNPAVLSDTTSSGVGVVKDVVPRRNFGFIALLDENNTRNEILFFHLPKDKRFAKGNEVKFDIALEGMKRVAINVEHVPNGTIPSVASKNACLGYVLMEPSHTTLKNTPARKPAKGNGDKIGIGRWAETKDDGKSMAVKQDMVEDGCILLLEDKTGMFQKLSLKRRKNRSASMDSVASSGDVSVDETKSVGSVDGLPSEDDGLSSDDGGREDNGIVSVLSRISYTNGSIAIYGAGATSSMDGSTNPKRGDLVSFVKGRKRKSARDIRIVKREKAILQRGRLENIQIIETEDKNNKGKAQFVAATENQEVYEIDLADVVSCSASILKEKESMEGILHEGKIYGLCRTSDLYLTSKLVVGSGKNRQRPKLNLTVRKDRGGTIMAQSMMAKGPDGTIGFKSGWTKLVSQYTLPDNDEIADGVQNDGEHQDDFVQSDINSKDEENIDDRTKSEEDANLGSDLKSVVAEDESKGNVENDADGEGKDEGGQ